MIVTVEDMMRIEPCDIANGNIFLQPEEIEKFVAWLSLKENDIRYKAFLLLQEQSKIDNSVYPFWDVFRKMLKNENSYQRSLGAMMLAENVQWDAELKMRDTISEYLELLFDPKPVTIRQCIQSLNVIVQKEKIYNRKITDAICGFEIMEIRESMRKLILLDIIYVLLEIKKSDNTSLINNFIFEALSGEILDIKSKKAIEQQL